MSFRPSNFLRYALLGDAAASGATGLLMAAGASYLTTLLGLPEELLRYAGLILLPYAAAIAWLGTRETLARGAVWTVIVINALWVLDSALLLLGGALNPTALGYAFVIFQAVVVGAFAEAQYMGLQRPEPRAAVAA